MRVYYNENDPKTAAWLRELIKAGLIADGEVDTRSIVDVRPDDIRGFVQCHFFAGIGGWSYALRLSGWPDDRECWTFSCPCQKFSAAARGRQVAIDMWPEQRRLFTANGPSVFFGEQVSHARSWFDGLCDDVEAMGYSVGAAVLPACGVGFDHARSRIWFVGHTNSHRQSSVRVNAEVDRLSRCDSDPGQLGEADGISNYVAAMSGFGNAIVPQVAAQFIAAYMDITA